MIPRLHDLRFCVPVFMATVLLSTGIGVADELFFEEFKPRVVTDFGHIVRGTYEGAKLDFHPVNRNAVGLDQGIVYDETWKFDAGFKAIIWWPFKLNANEPYQRNIRVEPRVSQIKATRNFGEAGFLEFGYFPYKYNPDARNLGEYLYRSGTYPGIVRSTDGFHLQNYAVFEAYGVHARWSPSGNVFTHDVNLFSEPTSIPIGDLTPAYEISLNLPLLQFGMGAAYNRLISYNSDFNRPDNYQNGYFQVDSVGGVGIEYQGPYAMAPGSVQTRIKTMDATVRPMHYFTQRGVKLMARAAVNFGELFPDGMRNPDDLRLFIEAALLGWENQPFFYEDRLQRVPVMFGLNLPTFRLLDLLSVQTEYYASRFSSSYDYENYAFPIWSVPEDYEPGRYKRDDWKWSVNLRKSMNRLLTLHAQFANDHLRMPEFNLNPSSTSLTQTPDNWYYLMRLECSL